MNTTRFSSRSISRSASLVATLALLFVCSLRAAETPDDRYLNIFSAIEQADLMNANGQTALARVKYIKAQADLTDFKRNFPLAYARAVAYRLNYLADKLAVTSTNSATTSGNNSTTRTGSTSEKKTASTASHGLKLLNAGAEPRVALRVHPTAGDKQSVTMTTKINMAMTMGENAMPSMKIPATQMTMDVTVKNVSANGDISYDLTLGDASVINDPEVMPQIAEAMKTSLGRFHGITGSGTMSDRGISLGMEMNVPADADAQSRQTLEQLKESVAGGGAAFPDEPIGIGAKWQVTRKLKSQGMTIDQTLTYELVSNEDGHLNLKTALSQSALNQKIQNPTMPGMKIDLTKMTGSGTGTASQDLTKLLPTESTSDAHSDMEMSLNMGGQKQTMSTKMDMNIHLGTN